MSEWSSIQPIAIRILLPFNEWVERSHCSPSRAWVKHDKESATERAWVVRLGNIFQRESVGSV